MDCSAKGYAAVLDGEIRIDTVSSTRRAAVVNFLVVARGLYLRQGTSDKEIDVFWEQLRRDATVIEVEIVPHPSAENMKGKVD